MARRSKQDVEAEAFRLRVLELRALPGADWNDWEADWLDSQARRPASTIPSDKERVILNQLIASAKAFVGYNGLTIPELIVMAGRYFADLDEASQDFVTGLDEHRPTTLRVRQIHQLARICRINEDIGTDEAVEGVMREVRRREHGADEWLNVA